MRRITIKGDRTAGYETCIDGVDVSSQLTGLQLQLGDGGQPELVVRTNAGRVEIEADAKVTLIDPEAELRSILQFLGEINPAVLEEAMLGGDMDSGPAEMALRALKRMAAESYGQTVG